MVNRKSERKRLVELIYTSPYGMSTFGDYFNRSYVENCMVPHLLDNGIDVPPVKVRQTVYSIINCKTRAEKLVVTSVHHYEEYSSFGALSRSQKKYYFEYEDIGKTVFTSREDAEQALGGVNK